MPSTSASAIPYVLQRDFLSVVVNGEQHPVSSSQPTFKALKLAIEKQQWGRIPKLLDVTQQIAQKSHGKVKVTKKGVFYRGNKVENSLTAKILELLEHGMKVDSMLRFMDNLYQQPDVNTVNRVYDWINSGRYTITSDGCIMGYKVVRPNYTDKHTGKVDNHIGARPLMARSAVDPSEFVECSRGYHVCVRGYVGGFYSEGDHIMVVKVNPADVVASPLNFGHRKFRCWTYEVFAEVGLDEINGLTSDKADAAIMMQPVIEIPDERPDILKKVKALPTVKRLMRRGKLTAASFRKASTERLIGWLRKFSRMDVAVSKSKLFDNPLRFAREAAGLTLGQVAKAAGMTLQETYNAERCLKPEQDVIDKVLIAIASLQGNHDIGRAGVSYPRPTAMGTGSSYPYSSSVSSYDDADDEEEEEEEDDDF